MINRRGEFCADAFSSSRNSVARKLASGRIVVVVVGLIKPDVFIGGGLRLREDIPRSCVIYLLEGTNGAGHRFPK